jgi:hypothetical protein
MKRFCEKNFDKWETFFKDGGIGVGRSSRSAAAILRFKTIFY